MNPTGNQERAILVVALLVAAELTTRRMTSYELAELIRSFCPDETMAMAVAMVVADICQSKVNP